MANKSYWSPTGTFSHLVPQRRNTRNWAKYPLVTMPFMEIWLDSSNVTMVTSRLSYVCHTICNRVLVPIQHLSWGWSPDDTQTRTSRCMFDSRQETSRPQDSTRLLLCIFRTTAWIKIKAQEPQENARADKQNLDCKFREVWGFEALPADCGSYRQEVLAREDYLNYAAAAWNPL